MKYLVGLLFVSMVICSCGQTKKSNNIEGITISPQIKDEAEKNFKRLEDYDELTHGFQMFKNNVTFEFYENDSLILSSEVKQKSVLFKSFYLWKGDTLLIDGGIGLFGGGGFSIQIIKGKATVYHMLSSDESPLYAYGEKTQLLDRLEVPCHDVKAILSAIPEKGKGTIIYGYVEFKSDSYYVREGIVDGKEFEPRKRCRANMKIYFKSGEPKI